MRFVCSSKPDCCKRYPSPLSAASISAGMMAMNDDAMATRMPVKFETASEDPWLNAVVITAEEPMRASGIQQVLEPAPT